MIPEFNLDSPRDIIVQINLKNADSKQQWWSGIVTDGAGMCIWVLMCCYEQSKKRLQ